MANSSGSGSRRILVIVLILVIVIVGGVIAFVLVSGSGGDDATPSSTQVARQPGDDDDTAPPANDEEALPTITPIPSIEVVVAVQEIPRGTVITSESVAILPRPEAYTEFSAFLNVEEVVGTIARTDILREQTVLSNMVVEDLTALADVGSDAAAILPSNRVAVSIPMDRITSVAYAIEPGDRVDIIVSMLFIDVDRQFQTIEPNSYNIIAEGDPDSDQPITVYEPAISGIFDTRLIPGTTLGQLTVLVSPSETPRPRLATQRTVQDALVIWTGNFPFEGGIFRKAATPTPVPTPVPEGSSSRGTAGGGEPTAVPPTPVPPRPDIVTLAVTPQDAVVLTWLLEAGVPMTFALRSASSPASTQTETVSLDYIMTRFSIAVPDKFEYSIEPAIRSIRQIEVGNRIQLTSQN